MTCACGMDSIGKCLVCGARLCAEHALRGSEYGSFDVQAIRGWAPLNAQFRAFGVSPEELSGIFPISLDRVRSDLRPLFRFSAQRKAFLNTLRASGVVCASCRADGALEAARVAPQPTAPNLLPGGSQRLRDAVAAYLLDDIVAWDSMKSDAALKDTLFRDLIHLAREKAERFHVPVEWEAKYLIAPPGGKSLWAKGEVRATEEVFHAVYVAAISGHD